MSGKREQAKGVTFPKIGEYYYVYKDGRNQLRGFGSLEEAQARAAEYFKPRRKKKI